MYYHRLGMLLSAYLVRQNQHSMACSMQPTVIGLRPNFAIAKISLPATLTQPVYHHILRFIVRTYCSWHPQQESILKRVLLLMPTVRTSILSFA